MRAFGYQPKSFADALSPTRFDMPTETPIHQRLLESRIGPRKTPTDDEFNKAEDRRVTAIYNLLPDVPDAPMPTCPICGRTDCPGANHNAPDDD